MMHAGRDDIGVIKRSMHSTVPTMPARFAADSGRFKGFKANVKRQPVQSMWVYTLDVGLAIKASNRDKIKKWTDLTGKKVYTGPLPFDTRLHLENAWRRSAPSTSTPRWTCRPRARSSTPVRSKP